MDCGEGCNSRLEKLNLYCSNSNCCSSNSNVAGLKKCSNACYDEGVEP